jgi:soluble lytic murein transglycosylase-like protein
VALQVDSHYRPYDYFTFEPEPGGGTPGPGGGKLDPSAPQAIKDFQSEIEDAASKTKLDPNLIAAVIWAESRGNPNEASRNPEDQSRVDKGLMQVSQETAGENGLRNINLSDSGKQILAGATELKNKIDARGGDVAAALQDYVGDDPKYVQNVLSFYKSLSSGKGMSDQDPA